MLMWLLKTAQELKELENPAPRNVVVTDRLSVSLAILLTFWKGIKTIIKTQILYKDNIFHEYWCLYIDNHFQLQVKGVKSYKENSVESYIWNVVVSFEKILSQHSNLWILK